MTSTMGFGTLRQIVFRRRPDAGRRSSTAWVRTLVASLALLLSTAGAAYAARDVVVTTSGDRLVGEIKKVEKDVLTFEDGLLGLGLQAQVGKDRLHRERPTIPGRNVRWPTAVGHAEAGW